MTQWKYEEYSEFSRQLAKNYTKKELEKQLAKIEKELQSATDSHLKAINRSISMQSQSQSRAMNRNRVSFAGQRKRDLQNALEIHEYYPEKVKHEEVMK